MKLMFVRHAEPDYSIDSLTEKGHIEAEILSHRLCKIDVKAYYVSPMGRAKATAAYTLDKLGRTAEELPWLAEYRGRSYDPFKGCDRFPWDYRPHEWQNRPLLWDVNRWTEDELTRTGTTAAIWKETCEGIDALLARHGYIRDGGIYRCEDNRPDTLMFFCHFGISMALIGHLTGISPMVLWQCFSALPSSVTTLVTEERDKGEVFFRCMQLGDLSHLYAEGERPSTAGQYPECYTGVDSTEPPEWAERKKR